MPDTKALVFGVLLPALFAGLVLLFLRRGAGADRPARPFLGALALGVGYLVAHVVIGGKLLFPGGDAQLAGTDWMALFVLGAVLLAPLRGLAATGRWADPLYLALFAVLSFRFPLERELADGLGGLAIRFALTLAMYAAWAASDRLAERVRGPALPSAWVAAGSAIALCALFSRTAFVAQLAGVLTAGIGAAAVVGWIDRGTRFSSGAIAIAWIGFAGVLVQAGRYDLPYASIALCVLALLAPWCVARSSFETVPVRRALLACAASALAGGAAVALAYRPASGG